MLSETVVPTFPRGTKLRFDSVRDMWVVLAPERAFQPDEHALEVLKLIDGQRDLAAILDDLCARFDAPRAVVSADVMAMLEDLAGRGVVTL